MYNRGWVIQTKMRRRGYWMTRWYTARKKRHLAVAAFATKSDWAYFVKEGEARCIRCTIDPNYVEAEDV